MMKATTILLVDDEPDALDFLSHNLKKAGYRVYTAFEGRSALEIAKQVLPNLIILDIMMPGMDGIEVCKELRTIPETKNTLIVLFTARAEDYSQIAGLDAGADDYILKPISPRILLSRLNAVLRRRIHIEDSHHAETVVDLGHGIKLNRDGNSIIIKQEEFVLPKKEFELISLLASKPGKLFSREQIASKLWGEGSVIGERTIDVHIRRLREKMGDSKIKTTRGKGYRFEF
jgi:two-component system alkaline phosphatase synthesis response regulator PhoP